MNINDFSLDLSYTVSMLPHSYETIARQALMHGPLEKLFCCIGDPVIGKPSQLMMEASLRACSLGGRYLTCTVHASKLALAIQGLKALGFSGANVTAPHKVEVVRFMDELTPSATIISAVNCITITNGRMIGDNTDGKGFARSIAKIADIKDMNVLVFGAGGASRAIIAQLGLNNARQITIANRTVNKAQKIVNDMQSVLPTKLEAIELTVPFLISNHYDLVVQATSVGLFDPLSSLEVEWEKGTKAIAADVVFNPVETKFLRIAASAGAKTVDGLGMLVQQGAIAIEQWTGETADHEAMRIALEKAFEN